MTYHSSPNINNFHRQVIMGTVLGGSSIVKPPKGRNCYLFMRSCNQNWIKYKAAELNCFSSEYPFTFEGNTLRWHSNCYPIFNEYREVFYKDGNKFIKMEVLDMLMDTALAIWFGDRGRVVRKKLILNTSNFGEEGTETIVQYFNEVDIDCKIHKERNRFKTQFTKEGTLRFFATVGHRIPEFMIKNLCLD